MAFSEYLKALPSKEGRIGLFYVPFLGHQELEVLDLWKHLRNNSPVFLELPGGMAIDLLSKWF